ncbi:SpaH/EbpB family LPXTG-anchored major pilin [Enterococcus hulanensis]|uniref:SpaH/EbpB family LPXTG-anchored major pilin n=1 Tax=Enterococcus hulanensis TaxID=2559929 RepID=UPI001A8E93CF|nr:SpaH/EbpB family LPXTG-anchored major pilin [Enterococcus hulanensis]MBO0458332.1 SpaH/EbpB family LPXTG-anchored major pilin [Enterococcus hulanensis]
MNKKWISKAALGLGVITMLGAAGTGPITVALAAEQNISSNTVSDNTSIRSVTIWKYEINSASELGDRGDGINPDPSQAPDLAGKKLMKDVNFEIIKVKPIGNASLTDPLKQEEGTDWQVDSTFTAMTGKTDGNGKLTFEVGTGIAADGIYLIREIKDSVTGDYTYTDENGDTKKINKPMDPFFVHLPQTKRDDTGKLIYDVHVYPKNIVTDTELDKTIEGGKGYSIKAGNDFQWEATTKLPAGLYSEIDKEMTITNWLDPADGTIKDLVIGTGDLPFDLFANYFRVSDSIDERLKLQDVEVYVLDKNGDPVKLTNGTEYEVTLAGTKITAPNKVEDLTLGAKKEVVVSLTQAGMKKVTVDEDTHLQVVYKVTTDKDFNGTISNKYGLEYLLPGQEPWTDTSEGNPEYYDGGFDIKKTDEGSTALAGAEFHIATNKENADAKKYLASDGKSYTLNDDGTSTPALPDGVNYLTAASDDSGKAEFNGLALDWFTDSNGNGKQDPSIDSEATWAKEDIKKDYWVVETKAPSGYELIKEPQKVTVTLETADDESIELTVENKKKTDLPFTGGAGMTLMVLIALGAIVLGITTIAIEKKRRQA